MKKEGEALSRRNLLIGGAAATVCALAIAAPRSTPKVMQKTREMLARTPLRRYLPLDYGDYAEWMAAVGQVFRISGGMYLHLVGVEPLGALSPRPSEVARDRAFQLTFDAMMGQTFPGDLIYTLHHTTHGEIPLYLTSSSDRNYPERLHAILN